MISKPLRIASWNVNGLRSCAKKGFREWLEASEFDIVGLQEVRATPAQLPKEIASPEGWWCHYYVGERAGYSGVALFSRQPPDQVEEGLGIEEFDAEGRYQALRFGHLWVINAYFPNGSGKERDNGRVPFKLRFYREVFDRWLDALREGGRVLIMGDFNTAHREIDLARPKANEKTSGFLPEERFEFDRWLDAGWVDSFRHFEPGPGHYSWWSQRSGARERNVGWRIDYVLASPGAMPFVQGAAIHCEVRGSDHCPVAVTLDAKVRE